MAGADGVRLPPGQTHPIGVNRAQDEAMVGYVFQRPTDQNFGVDTSAFQTKQTPRAWALADDGIIDNVSILKHLTFSIIIPIPLKINTIW